MGYKLRNKSVLMTFQGFKNNVHYKVLNKSEPVKSEDTVFIRTSLDHYSFIRLMQNYRNISRTTKKYFFGDKMMEQKFVLYLKKFFRSPITSGVPIHLIDNHFKRFADQWDREWELYSFNHHPRQLDAYRDQAEQDRKVREDDEIRRQGKMTMEDQYENFISEKIKEETQKKNEKLNMKELDKIFRDATEILYASMGMKQVRDNDGNFNDFVEHRRPQIEVKEGDETK